MTQKVGEVVSKAVRQRIEWLAAELDANSGDLPGVKQRWKEKFHKGPWTWNMDLRQARDMLIEATGRARNELQAESYHFLERIKRDEKAKPWEKIKAQEVINKLLGLDSYHKETDLEALIRILGPVLGREVGEALARMQAPQPDHRTNGHVLLPAPQPPKLPE